MIPGMFIRPFEPGDTAYVFDSWLETAIKSEAARSIIRSPALRRYRHYFGGRSADLFFFLERRRATSLLKTRTVLVAEANGVLLGWACGGPERTLDYVVVKEAYQREGVARALVEALGMGGTEPVRCTYQTDCVVRERLPANFKL